MGAGQRRPQRVRGEHARDPREVAPTRSGCLFGAKKQINSATVGIRVDENDVEAKPRRHDSGGRGNDTRARTPGTAHNAHHRGPRRIGLAAFCELVHQEATAPRQCDHVLGTEGECRAPGHCVVVDVGGHQHRRPTA
ncbi:unannotated protein [freshwater metagenome]|uniref:Unannotated protein n=1 Tax=freshwater metagenome TaxID=449393 RepID=A0A6J7BW22_9ZZZZ